jgi:hypothetical protein
MHGGLARGFGVVGLRGLLRWLTGDDWAAADRRRRQTGEWRYLVSPDGTVTAPVCQPPVARQLALLRRGSR